MTNFRNRYALSALAVVLLASSAVGCGSLSRTEKGAIIGAGAGAAVGGAIGRATGNTARGAIIGAAVGGTAGAIIGQQMDRQARELEEEIANGDVERVGEGIQITFNNAILFDFGKSDLKGTARTDLADLARSLQKYPNTDVMVYGHTDSVGSDDFNQGLSERRAEAAASYLVSQGISRSRITTIGRGERSPIASNDTDAGRAQNRRVEIAIVASEEFRRQAAQQSGGR
jgi:outer membrane protein OmpA-like peptidoglycan-associated protein